MKFDFIYFVNQYNSLFNEYVLYLKGIRIVVSLREEVLYRLVVLLVCGKVDYMIIEIESRFMDNVLFYI